MCSTKIGYTNALSMGTNSFKKRNMATLNNIHEARKQCNFDWNNSRVVYIAFTESFKPMRFVQCWQKVERKYIQEQQPNQFHCYNLKMGFANRMGQHVAKYRIDKWMKKWLWSLFVWMVDLVFQGLLVLYCINNEGDESLPLLAFWRDVVNAIFPKYSKEDR